MGVKDMLSNGTLIVTDYKKIVEVEAEDLCGISF